MEEPKKIFRVTFRCILKYKHEGMTLDTNQVRYYDHAIPWDELKNTANLTFLNVAYTEFVRAS